MGLVVSIPRAGRQVGPSPVRYRSIGCANSLGGGMAGDILAALKLRPNDRVLALDCGSLELARHLADHCASVVAIAEAASPGSESANLTFESGSLRDPESLPIDRGVRLDKVVLYGGLQRLSPAGLAALMDVLVTRLMPGFTMLLGSVPDSDRKWLYYDTPTSRFQHWILRRIGREEVRHWWSREALRTLLGDYELDCRFLQQSSQLTTSRYCFDLMASPRGDHGK